MSLKSLPARSRRAGSTRGKSIIVPRIDTSPGTFDRASYHPSLASRDSRHGTYRPVCDRNIGCKTSQFSRPFTGPLNYSPDHRGTPSGLPSWRTRYLQCALRNSRLKVPDRRSSQVKKLYVGNLPFSASEEQLQEWFGQAGVNPSAISLIRDRFTGQSRGFAFIEIASDEDADRAINSLNGQNFGGRNLVVNEARPQTERSAGGGGRGGYGGGGGGRGGDRGGRGGGGRGGDRGDRGDRGNRS